MDAVSWTHTIMLAVLVAFVTSFAFLVDSTMSKIPKEERSLERLNPVWVVTVMGCFLTAGFGAFLHISYLFCHWGMCFSANLWHAILGLPS